MFKQLGKIILLAVLVTNSYAYLSENRCKEFKNRVPRVYQSMVKMGQCKKIDEESQVSHKNKTHTTIQKPAENDFSLLEKNAECISEFLLNKHRENIDKWLKDKRCKSSEYYTKIILDTGDANQWTNKNALSNICKHIGVEYSKNYGGGCNRTGDYTIDTKIENLTNFYKEYTRLNYTREKNNNAVKLVLTDKDIKTIDATKSKISKDEMIKLMRKLNFKEIWTELVLENGTQFLYLKYYENGTYKMYLSILKIPIKKIKKIQKNGVIIFKDTLVLDKKKNRVADYYVNDPHQNITTFDIDKNTGYSYKTILPPLSEIIYILQQDKFKGTIKLR